MYYSGAFIPYVVLVVASLVLGLGTQWYIKHEFKKYSLVPSGFISISPSLIIGINRLAGA